MKEECIMITELYDRDVTVLGCDDLTKSHSLSCELIAGLLLQCSITRTLLLVEYGVKVLRLIMY